MCALKQMREMLDGLMGTGRNGEDNSLKEKFHYSNPRVCKSFLLNCCPHEVLAQTRFDLGKCPKVHDIALRADFEKSLKHEHEFQVEAYQLLKNFLTEIQRRSQVAKLRLAVTQDTLNNEEGKRINHLRQIDDKINDNIKKVEKLGAVGDVEESLKLLKVVDSLKEEKWKKVTEFKSRAWASLSQQKNLRVCEVCSSYLGLNDDDKRLADHFNGKLHLGFSYIKEKYEELKILIQERCIKDVLDSEFESPVGYKRNHSDSPTSQNKYLRCDPNNNNAAASEPDHIPKEKIRR